MASHIRSLIPSDPPTDVIGLDEESPSLTDFYGNRLDGHFERYRY